MSLKIVAHDMEIRINTYTSYSVYFDSTINRKLLQSDLPFACYYSRIVQYLILQRSKSGLQGLLVDMVKEMPESI